MSDHYAAAGVPVRDDLRAVHRLILEHIGRPGTWWNGAQRVAIAAEARCAARCELCAARTAALRPGEVVGKHDSTGALPADLVDVIHRIRIDPAMLSRAWFDSVIAGGVSEAEYVELVAVVTLLTGLDFFCLALGVDPFPLPDPSPGTPSRHTPKGAKPGTAWVPMIAPEDAAGVDADMYPAAPLIPNIVRALSLVPDEVRMLRRSSDAHYLPVVEIGDPSAHRGALDRMQTELVAARVSALNECFY